MPLFRFIGEVAFVDATGCWLAQAATRSVTREIATNWIVFFMAETLAMDVPLCFASCVGSEAGDLRSISEKKPFRL